MSDNWRYHGKPAPTNQTSSTIVSGHVCPTCGQLHSPVTASDARPPSDEVCGVCGAPFDASGDCSVVGNRRHPRPPSDTGTTGWHWHTHSGRAAYRDDQCARHADYVNPARPVLVVDPAAARETIARALRGEGLTDNPAEYGDGIHSWRCSYPDPYGPCSCFEDAVSAVFAALAGQGQP